MTYAYIAFKMVVGSWYLYLATKLLFNRPLDWSDRWVVALAVILFAFSTYGNMSQ